MLRLDQDRCAAPWTMRLLLADGRHADRRRRPSRRNWRIVVDDRRAAFSAWYELFPRSYSPHAGQHGTLRDADCAFAVRRIDGVSMSSTCRRSIPLARAFRKGKNNHENARARRCRQPLGNRRGGGGAQGGASEPWARSTIFALVAAAAEQQDRNRARHRLSMFARSSVCERASRSGFDIGPTARSSTPKIRRRNIRTFIPSISSATIGRPCGKN